MEDLAPQQVQPLEHLTPRHESFDECDILMRGAEQYQNAQGQEIESDSDSDSSGVVIEKPQLKPTMEEKEPSNLTSPDPSDMDDEQESNSKFSEEEEQQKPSPPVQQHFSRPTYGVKQPAFQRQMQQT